MRTVTAWLTDPGRPLWATLAVRLVLAAVFVPAGRGKFVNHDTYVERFERWGFGAAAGEVGVGVHEHTFTLRRADRPAQARLASLTGSDCGVMG